MYNYMYQYRGDIERIIKTICREKAKDYVQGLYDTGLVDLVEWQTLNEYTDTYRKSYRGI